MPYLVPCCGGFPRCANIEVPDDAFPVRKRPVLVKYISSTGKWVFIDEQIYNDMWSGCAECADTFSWFAVSEEDVDYELNSSCASENFLKSLLEYSQEVLGDTDDYDPTQERPCSCGKLVRPEDFSAFEEDTLEDTRCEVCQKMLCGDCREKLSKVTLRVHCLPVLAPTWKDIDRCVPWDWGIGCLGGNDP